MIVVLEPGGVSWRGPGSRTRITPTPRLEPAPWSAFRNPPQAMVAVAVAEGFRPVGIETAGDDEWEQFESGYQADLEVWLAAHGGHPAATSIREQADAHRCAWLDGYRGVWGMAYRTPAPVRTTPGAAGSRSPRGPPR